MAGRVEGALVVMMRVSIGSFLSRFPCCFDWKPPPTAREADERMARAWSSTVGVSSSWKPSVLRIKPFRSRERLRRGA